MGSYKVTSANGVTVKGKAYANGETANISKQAAQVYLNLGQLKEVGGKENAKSAAKKAAAPKKGAAKKSAASKAGNSGETTTETPVTK